MSKYILGISAYYHDSAAVLLRDSEIVAAAQEERFSRKKHDPRFPFNAINYCLEEAFIESDDVDSVVFYDRPIVKLDRIVKSSLFSGTRAKDYFIKAIKSTIESKIHIEGDVIKSIGTVGKEGSLLYSTHHLSHAASAFYPSPFKSAAIITLDGVGEWSTTTVGAGNGRNIELIDEINYPHSLGLLYSAFTYYCGFKVNSGEYKLMGLAPYGDPTYYDIIMQELIDVKSDGSYRLNMKYFGYMSSNTMINNQFCALFGGQAREQESKITIKEMNLAASIQKVIENVLILIAKSVKKKTGMSNLVLAGGVALNCVANGRLSREDIFDNIWIQPAAGDAGGALGSALAVAYMHYGIERKVSSLSDSQKGSYLGEEYTEAEIRLFLEEKKLKYTYIEDNNDFYKKIASMIDDGNVIGYMNGRMEFGPRSLGTRSIIGDPRNSQMQSKMNIKIKYRESFRPFAPSVLLEDVNKYFDHDGKSLYMLIVAPVSEAVRSPGGCKFDVHQDMLSMINTVRSEIPAVTHVDCSARVHTVEKDINEDFYGIINAFKQKTGCSVVINTSFNVRGEPIVRTPLDAYRCFMRTEMDVLVIGKFILLKDKQDELEDDIDWRKEYELD